MPQILNELLPPLPIPGETLRTHDTLVSMHNVLSTTLKYRAMRGFYTKGSDSGHCIVHVYGGAHRREDYQYYRQYFTEKYPDTLGGMYCLLDAISNPFLSYIILREPPVTLRTILDSRPEPFDRIQTLEVIYQIILGVEALHREEVQLGDLRPENIEIFDASTREVEYFDVDLMTHANRTVMNSTSLRVVFTGTCRSDASCDPSVIVYQAPELVLGLPWSEMADSFSVGCVAYEVMTQRPAFMPYSNVQFQRLQMLAQYHKICGPVTPQYLARLPPMPGHCEIMVPREGTLSLRIRQGQVITPEIRTHMNSTDMQYRFAQTDFAARNFVIGLLKLDDSDRASIEEAKYSPLFLQLQQLDPVNIRVAVVDE